MTQRWHLRIHHSGLSISLLLVSASVLVACGSGQSLAPNPVPTIASLSPSSVTAGAPATTLTITGTGFLTTSSVQWNQAPRTATYVSGTQLTVALVQSDLTTGEIVQITVTDPAPGGGTSNVMTFTINNPVPSIFGLSQAGAAVGSGATTLNVSGSGFDPASVVQWNRTNLPTTFLDNSSLSATVAATNLLQLGNFSVSVFNPAPGGGFSASLPFTTYLALPTNDLVYNPVDQLLYATVPSSAGSPLGNSIVSIDPNTGLIGAPIWVGSEPNRLAISDDGTTAWVSLLGSPSMLKADPTAGPTPVQVYFPGGWGENFYVTDVKVLPGTTDSVAAAEEGIVSIYDDSVQRPKTSSDYSVTSSTAASFLTFGTTPSTLYGYYYTPSLIVYSVDSTGISAAQNPTSPGQGSYDLRFDNGRLYLTSGGVFDAATGNLLGTFAAAGPVAPDSSVGRAFILNSPNNVAPAPTQVTAFDLQTFASIGSVAIGGIQPGSFPLATPSGPPMTLVRWGQDGLAFRNTGQLYILHSALVRDLSGTPADVSVRVAAPASSVTGAQTTFTITVTNNGPNAAANVVLVTTTTPAAIPVSATASQGTCSGAAVVSCSLGSLASGATVTVVVLPSSAGSLTDTALVSAATFDPDDSNNTASASTTVTGNPYGGMPILTSLAPQSAAVGSPALSLTVNGANFAADSTVAWNGISLATSFVSASQLTATVDAGLLSSPGYANVTVQSGTFVSALLPFSIFQSVALDANDIVFDPFTRQLYASVPSTATQVAGNSIVAIDPASGALGSPIAIGSEPTRMSISDDGQYLYTVLSGTNEVRRLDLPTLTLGTRFTPVGGVPAAPAPYAAEDVSVMPGNHDAVVTVGYAHGIQLWDVSASGAIPRPLTVSLGGNIYEGDALAWGDSSHLYSNDEGLDPSQLHRFSVGSTSFAEMDATYLDGVAGAITYSGGLIFSDGGSVVDPSGVPPVTPHLAGRYINADGTGGGASAVDTILNRVFFLNPNSYGVTSRTISSFDAKKFIPAATLEMNNILGDAFDLRRWGKDGLAFRMRTDFWGNGTGQILLVNGPFVLPRSSTLNPAPSLSSTVPSNGSVGGSNLWLTVVGSQFVPGAVVQWNGADRTTFFVDSGHLHVAIPAADLTVARTVTLQVLNPDPSAGASGTLSFVVQ
jgi:trimeric autotransporter adhesin